MSIFHKHFALRAATACFAVVLWTQGAVAQDLLVQWDFDEEAGGSADALDGGLPPDTTGVLGATATRSTDTPGGGPGFSLDLTDPAVDTSIVNGGNPTEVDTLTQLTFSTWVKVTSETDYNEGGSGNVRLLSKQEGTLFDGFSWNLNAPLDTGAGEVRSNNAFRMGLFVGGQDAFAFSFADENILDRGGDWLFLAVTYDGTQLTQNTKFYVGDETSGVTQLGSTGDLGAGQIFSTNTANGGAADANFGIGFTDALAGVDFALSGLQDDVRVYDGVLDVAALDAVRLANLPGGPSDPADLNGDSFVDGLDLGILLGNFNQNAAPSGGELNGTDPVDGLDLGILLGAWNPPVADLSAVPEPSTLALGLVMAMSCATRRLRR